MQRSSITRSRPSGARRTTGSGRFSAPLKNRCTGVPLVTFSPAIRTTVSPASGAAGSMAAGDPGITRSIRSGASARSSSPNIQPGWAVANSLDGVEISSGQGSGWNPRCEAFNSPRSARTIRANCRESLAVAAARSYFNRRDSQSVPFIVASWKFSPSVRQIRRNASVSTSSRGRITLIEIGKRTLPLLLETPACAPPATTAPR
jgi:hypothetical protein